MLCAKQEINWQGRLSAAMLAVKKALIAMHSAVAFCELRTISSFLVARLPFAGGHGQLNCQKQPVTNGKALN